MVVPTRRTKRRRADQKYTIFALAVLLLFWLVGATCLWIRWKQDTLALKQYEPDERQPDSRILSRFDNVTATTDVRGNLGPAETVVQKIPGKDWIKDRWQAASNMHGKNIPGSHWVLLDFGTEIFVDKIVLDWEAAYADKYILEGSIEDPTINNDVDKWVLFDGTDPSQEKFRSTETSGQSPGVKTKTPLHVVHTLGPLETNKRLRYLRLNILKSAMGWGGKTAVLILFSQYHSSYS